VSTAVDYLRFAQFMWKGMRLLGPRTVELMAGQMRGLQHEHTLTDTTNVVASRYQERRRGPRPTRSFLIRLESFDLTMTVGAEHAMIEPSHRERTRSMCGKHFVQLLGALALLGLLSECQRRTDRGLI
jgi:hypothetical protein